MILKLFMNGLMEVMEGADTKINYKSISTVIDIYWKFELYVFKYLKIDTT